MAFFKVQMVENCQIQLNIVILIFYLKRVLKYLSEKCLRQLIGGKLTILVFSELISVREILGFFMQIKRSKPKKTPLRLFLHHEIFFSERYVQILIKKSYRFLVPCKEKKIFLKEPLHESTKFVFFPKILSFSVKKDPKPMKLCIRIFFS